MWEIIPLSTTKSTHKTTFLGIFEKFYYGTLAGEKLINVSGSGYGKVVLFSAGVFFVWRSGIFTAACEIFKPTDGV
jgi:hypothetical protein